MWTICFSVSDRIFRCQTNYHGTATPAMAIPAANSKSHCQKRRFLRTAKIVMFRCARLNDLKKWINLPPSRDIWVYRRLQGVVVRINQKGRGDSPSGTNRPRGNRNRMEFRHSTCLIMLSAMWFQRFSFFSQNEGAIPAPQLESPLYQKVWSVPYCRYR